ncbi:MAG TPA: [Fe-Fe] hydrogenase large subunit C-terminal domain-containing protein [Bacteroidales bacterium]|nr:[Fe-Fe] hydrogenase large subunit C-terminal domain-containing protein [Bacteroidales bacterium]
MKSAPTSFPPLFSIDPRRCDACYGCVRSCPVTAITVRVNKGGPHIDPARCIGCGDCLRACPEGSVSIRDSMAALRTLLAGEAPVAAIVGPSIAGEFEDITDYRKFVQMIRSLGFRFVHEASFGADLVAMQYSRLFEDNKGKFYLTANCPALVSYVEKYHPDLVSNLAPLVSPMIAAGRVLREIHGPHVRLVYIGPCIASKEEALRYPDDPAIDAVLTFTELRTLFKENNIDENTLEFAEFDPPFGHKGALYPIPAGILEAGNIDRGLLSGTVITVDGSEGMQRAVEEFRGNIAGIQHHFNLFYCEGCMMGPGTSPGGNKLRRRTAITRYVNKRLSDFDMDTWESYMLRFGKLDLSPVFHVNDQRLPDPPEEKIHEILTLLGKGDGPDTGCAACGFRSCREFATAVAHGLVKTDMCVEYAIRTREEYVSSLRRSNERLQNVQRDLMESERSAREELLKVNEALDRTSTVLQKLHSAVVVADQELRIVQSNRNFIYLLGKEAAEISEIIPGLVGADLRSLLPFQFYNLFLYVLQNGDEAIHRDVHLEDKLLNVTVFTIRKHEVVGAVIRDMYMPEVQKDEVIKRVTEVITENLGMVQKIGFLLGEGAARTERMLNSIIESYQQGSKDKPESDG